MQYTFIDERQEEEDGRITLLTVSYRETYKKGWIFFKKMLHRNLCSHHVTSTLFVLACLGCGKKKIEVREEVLWVKETSLGRRKRDVHWLKNKYRKKEVSQGVLPTIFTVLVFSEREGSAVKPMGKIMHVKATPFFGSISAGKRRQRDPEHNVMGEPERKLAIECIFRQ